MVHSLWQETLHWFPPTFKAWWKFPWHPVLLQREQFAVIVHPSTGFCIDFAEVAGETQKSWHLCHGCSWTRAAVCGPRDNRRGSGVGFLVVLLHHPGRYRGTSCGMYSQLIVICILNTWKSSYNQRCFFLAGGWGSCTNNSLCLWETQIDWYLDLTFCKIKFQHVSLQGMWTLDLKTFVW